MDTTHLTRNIRDARTLLGFTQTHLAEVSGVSLPAIQQIEAGKGNPSLSTLNAIFEALHLRIQIQPEHKADWNLLVACGAPLTSKKSLVTKVNSAVLARVLRQAALELFSGETNSKTERRREAIEALLLALKTHYPTWYNKNCRARILEELTPNQPTGRHIKLRRIALEKLSTYL